jgi:pimeloyl-ACP methyl ester carboxylesterase
MFATECNSNTAFDCPIPVQPLPLAEALARFRSEARFGFCDTGRYSCPFFEWGTGPVLVCVPGLLDQGRSFVPLLALLKDRFRCVAYDWPTGRGDGAHLPTYRHADLVNDLLALLDHVNAAQATVLGYSFGSTVALAALHARPSLLRRGVLVSGFARRLLGPGEELLAAVGRFLPGVVRQLPWRTQLVRASVGWAFAGADPAVWEFYERQTGDLPTAAACYRACVLHRGDFRALLPRIQQPVLLVCGDCDPLVNRQCEMDLLTGLRQAARVGLESCGHLAVYTHPGQVAEAILEFCERDETLFGSPPGKVTSPAAISHSPSRNGCTP